MAMHITVPILSVTRFLYYQAKECTIHWNQKKAMRRGMKDESLSVTDCAGYFRCVFIDVYKNPKK